MSSVLRFRGRFPAIVLVTLVALAHGCGASASPSAPAQTPRARPAATRGVVTRTRERARDPGAIGDREIAAAIMRRVGRDEAIPPNAIEVAVERGSVTLGGTVPHLATLDRAREIAEGTRGVRHVAEQVQWRGAERDDASLRTDVANALAWDAELASQPITVEVAGGRVTLAGSVEWLTDAWVAESLARSVRGARAVESALRVEPAETRDDASIEQALRAALERDVRIDPRGIQIAIEAGRVTLDGVVGSAIEREVARELASRAGALDVDASGWTCSGGRATSCVA